MEMVLNNIDLILTALVIIITTIILARHGQIEMIRELVLSLVVGAENEFGSKTGAIKKSDVTAKIYSMLPTISKLLIPGKTISSIIEDAKKEMDDLGLENQNTKNDDV